MGRKIRRLVILIFSMMLFLTVSSIVTYYVVGFVSQRDRDLNKERIELERIQYEESLEEKALEKEKTLLEEESLKAYNLFEKLELDFHVDFLLLGESLLQDKVHLDVSPFGFSIEDEIKDRYNSFCEVDFLDLYDDSILLAWKQYNDQERFYDCSIITFNFNDNCYLGVENFGLYTEALTRKMIDDNEAIQIIYVIDYEYEWDSKGYSDLYKELKEIALLYDVQIVDMNKALVDNYDEEMFLVDGCLSLIGYQWYANNILEVVDQLVEGNSVSTESGLKESVASKYKKVDTIMDYEKVLPNDNQGFKALGATYLAENIGDYLSFRSSGDVGLITYISDFEGGKFEIYINDELYDEVDTRSETLAMKTLVITERIEENTGIRIVVSVIDHFSSRNSVHIVGLSTN